LRIFSGKQKSVFISSRWWCWC